MEYIEVVKAEDNEGPLEGRHQSKCSTLHNAHDPQFTYQLYQHQPLMSREHMEGWKGRLRALGPPST